MYKQPSVKSSYNKGYDLGKVIYDYVMEIKPEFVVEIGSFRGYSAICIAQALRDIGEGGMSHCYDLWDFSMHASCKFEEFRKNITDHGLINFVNATVLSFDEAITLIRDNIYDGDMLHIDIGNDGDIIRKVYDAKICKNVIFEGGSKERDNVKWMVNQKRKPISGCCPYTILDEHFPSISVMNY